MPSVAERQHKPQQQMQQPTISKIIRFRMSILLMTFKMGLKTTKHKLQLYNSAGGQEREVNSISLPQLHASQN